MKVSVALDRFFTIKFSQWSTGFFKGKIVLMYAFMIGLVLMILDSCVLATNGYIDYTNGTETVVCFAWYNNNWSLFDLFGQVFD